jgi:hypothetical protein
MYSDSMSVRPDNYVAYDEKTVLVGVPTDVMSQMKSRQILAEMFSERDDLRYIETTRSPQGDQERLPGAGSMECAVGGFSISVSRGTSSTSHS